MKKSQDQTEGQPQVGSDALLGWWFVRVQLRLQDMSIQCETRAAFKNQGEAELYSREWDGMALTEVFQPNTKLGNG